MPIYVCVLHKGIINRSDFDVTKLNSCVIMSVDSFCECFDKLYSITNIWVKAYG